MPRELETVRRRLLSHLEAIRELESDAPSEALAEQYAQLGEWIEARIAALDASDAPSHVPAAAAIPAEREPQYDPPGAASAPSDALRTGVIVLLGLGAVALLAILLIRFFAGDDRPEIVRTRDSAPAELRRLDEEAVTIEEVDEPAVRAAEPSTAAAPPPRQPAARATLTVEPQTAEVSDFGSGRVVRQFRIENPTRSNVRISVERSTCRCLWYDYDPEVAAGGAVVLAITVDGARLEGDRLAESLSITDAERGNVLANIHLTGTR